MKKILIVTDNVPNQVNGVMTTYKNIEALAKKDGYQVNYLSANDLQTIPLAGYNEIRIGNPMIAAKKLSRLSFNYIHLSTEGPIGLGAKLFCDRNSIPYTTAYHTRFPEIAKKIYKVVPLWLSYSYLRWFHSKSKSVLVPSNSTKQNLIERGFDERTIRLWTRGVSDLYRQNAEKTIEVGLRKNWKKNSSFQNDKIKAIYVGRISKEKNLESFLQYQNIYDITIVGDGPLLKSYVKKYPRVKFLGYQTGQKLIDLYINSDVMVFPSDSDTFGIVIIEAMSLGIPVAAYPIPSPIDVITHGKNGFMGDDLSSQITNCALHLTDREKIIKSTKDFSWENCWKAFRDNLSLAYSS